MPAAGSFTLPWLERVVSGPGTLQTAGEELARLGAGRAVIVTGRTLSASPMFVRLQEALGSRAAGVFAEARQHVPASSVTALTSVMHEVGADSLVTLGGGSPIDTAKAAVHARLEGSPRDGRRALPHIAIPTTLSAGEFTDVAGVTDEATRIKQALADPRIAPTVVIADPEATTATPAWLWAASGIRALDHAVETIYSSRHHPFSEALAARAIELLLARLPSSLQDGDVAARSDCQMAAWMAVYGVTNAGFGLSHVLGHQIGPRWNVPHGVTSAVMLPHAMRFMAAVAPERFEPIARGLGLAFDVAAPRAGALACADRVATFIARFGLPARLRDVGVPRGETAAIAGHVAAVMARERAVDRPITDADLNALCDAAY